MRFRNRSGFLYLITDRFDRVKIGTSVDLKKRLNSLKTGNPGIRIFGYVRAENCTALENVVHCHLKKFNIGGEWFSPAGETIFAALGIIRDIGQKYGADYIVINPNLNQTLI